MQFPNYIKVRYIVCFIAWLSLLVFYEFRSNMSINIVAMVKPKDDNNKGKSSSSTDGSCSNSESSAKEAQYDSFSWSTSEQGFIVSGFFYGYICTHVVGSFISLRFGLRITMIVCLAGATLFTFLSVPCANWGFGALVFARVMTGFFSGPLYPIMHETLGHWAPSSQRTVLVGLTHSGNIIGLVFNFGVGGFIVGSSVKGWETLLYVGGAMGLVSLILWVGLVFTYPSTHPFITVEERDFIVKGTSSHEAESGKEMFKKLPFKKIVTSTPVYMVSLAHCGANFIIYALLTGHAKYLHDVFRVSKDNASYLSIIPFMSNFVVQTICPFLTDMARSKSGLSTTTIRKINTCIGFLGGAIFLMPVGYVPCDKIYLSILLISLSMAMVAMNQSGYFTAMIDLSPTYSGVIMGYANTFGSLAGIIQPAMTAALTKSGNIKAGYQKTFIITAIISVVLGFSFILFGSSEKQEWADGQLPTKLIDSDHHL